MKRLFIFIILLGNLVVSLAETPVHLKLSNRTSTERPEAIDKADFIISGIDEKSLLQAVEAGVALCRDGLNGLPVPDYVDECVSAKVVKIIQSYVGIVNKMVWRKF